MSGMRNLRGRLLAAASALGLAGAAAAQTAPPPANRVLRVAPHADLRTLDPMFASIGITRLHAGMIYETLFAWTAGMEPRPQMVERWASSPDNLVWSFTLRPGLRFHDGRPVTSRDVAASLDRWMRRDTAGGKLREYAAGVEVVDERRFTLRLSRPQGFVLFSLGSAVGQMPVIMREADARTDPFAAVAETVGSGPFRFNRAEWRSGSRVVYDRNPDYVPREEAPDGLTGGRVAKVDRVEWHILPDPATASAALTAGEIDAWENPSADLLPLLRRNRSIAVELLDFMGQFPYLRPNHLHPPFNNPGVRRAVLAAVNPVDVARSVMGNDPELLRDRPVGIFSPLSPLASDAGMEAFTQSVERGRELLRAAGYAGERTTLLSATDLPWLANPAMVVADVMRRMGMNVDYVATDWGTVVQRRNSREPPGRGGWSAFTSVLSGFDVLDPAALALLRGNGADAWIGWPTSPELERLREAWLDAPSLDAQRDIGRRIQEVALTDAVPYIPLGQFFQPAAYRRTLTGLLKGPPVPWGVRRVG